MGNYKANDGLGNQSSRNGYDYVPGPNSWRDSIVAGRSLQKNKRKEVMLFIGDVIGLGGILAGRFFDLTDPKQLLVFAISVLYLSIRTGLLALKAWELFIKVSRDWREFKIYKKKVK